MRLKDITILGPQYSGKAIPGDVSFVPMECLRNGNIDAQEISFNEAKGKYTFFADGDLLMAKVTPCFENGNIAVAKELKSSIGFGSSEIFVLRMKKQVLNSYMFYVTQATPFKDGACATMCGVGGLKRITPLFMKSFELEIPSPSSQEKIVNYLNAKCVEINNQISILTTKRSKYQLLRKSTIHHAVTKGLDSEATLQDSKIDWIETVPSHWNEYELKSVLEIRNGKDYKEFETSEGIPVIGSGGIFSYVNEAMYNGEAVCLGRKGTIDRPIYMNGPFWAVDTMFYAIPNKGVCCKYIYYLATCFPFTKVSTATALPSTTQTDLNSLIVFIPEFEEQKQIADFLDEKCAKIDSAIEIIDKQIAKYTELKKSLINEVITGKRVI